MLLDFVIINIANIQNEPNSMQDLLLQLGISNKINMFRKAKQNNFTTFFSGPQQIRYMIDVDYDTLDHQNFITQFLIDGNLCLKNGKVSFIFQKKFISQFF